ncbi:alpha-galactosidase [Clostridium estertheticum]|uniref:glycoside hydrolase family 36 protein n=1 Tax=Clostridium estertheticum TaxID=238834 RepID=UPI0013E93E15|nr:glycoside hydrolase family 36 protein [Clostridium estertheticum]MBZ9687497.1 alpha-galactosidase [Clostridium estertheticum]
MNIKNGLIVYTLNNIRKECNFYSNIDKEDFKIIINNYVEADGLRINVKIIPKIKLEVITFLIEMDEKIEVKSHVFLNGYQTWTNSREFNLKECIPKLKKIAWPIMSVYGDYGFYEAFHNKLQSFTYTYIRWENSIKLFGSISEKTGYTVFEYDNKEENIKVIKDCSGLVIESEYEAFNLFFIEGEENYSFDKYFEAMKLPKPKVPHCTGWTSWYNYYTKITEKIVIDNLNAFKSRDIPIEIFQIDDGYQETLGDWLHVNKKFPSGMGFIASEIKKSGYKAGIWLAPFVCDKKSLIYKEHPSWILKKVGFNPGWNGFFYVLDFYNEEVRDYIKEVFHTVLNVWNYDMVKLDFLYAVALIPRKEKTRGQIMYEAMEFLREICGDKIILGCGVPLGSSFGFTDYCRIGSDVSLSWEDKILSSLHYRERVSTINCIESTIGRRHLNNHAFLNDPDVFIIRSKNNKLTQNQRYTLLLINLIFGGLVFTSDNISEYSEEEMQLYKSIFPIREKIIKNVSFSDVVRIRFMIDSNEYLALSNLKASKLDVAIETGSYINKEKGLIVKNTIITLEPYESICLIKAETLEKKYMESTNIFML